MLCDTRTLAWPTDVWALIPGLKQQTRNHGTWFEYRSIETDVLAFCREGVTGKRLPKLFQMSSGKNWGPKKARVSQLTPLAILTLTAASMQRFETMQALARWKMIAILAAVHSIAKELEI